MAATEKEGDWSAIRSRLGEAEWLIGRLWKRGRWEGYEEYVRLERLEEAVGGMWELVWEFDPPRMGREWRVEEEVRMRIRMEVEVRAVVR